MTTTRLLRVGDVQLHRVCEDLSEPLIYLMVLFSPWAFGTTQPWAIWTMNVAGYVLGALLLAKLAVRHWKGYRPPRWEGSKEQGAGNRELGARSAERKHRTSNIEHRTSKVQQPRTDHPQPTRAPSSQHHAPSSLLLAILTLLILGYCLISAVNARSTYHRGDLSFEYHRYLAWLPHSFDSGRTWFAFWNYLALACSFWAVRDWLLGKTDGEERADRQQGARSGEQKAGSGGPGAGSAETKQPTSNIEHPTSNIGHSISASELQGHGTTDDRMKGSPSPGGEGWGEGGSSTNIEHRTSNIPPSPSSQLPSSAAPLLPTRLRRLLWVLAINGGLLGLEGIVQRLEGSGRLLFLVKPRVNPAGETQFGPWAYRANASAYFNLLWPVCLAFWWTLHRNAGVNLLSPARSSRAGGERANRRQRSGDGNQMRSATRHHLLLACAAVMAACPIISTSRGGAMVTVGLVLAAALFMAWAQFFFEEPGRLRIKVRIPRSAVRGQGTASRERGAGSKVQRDAQAPPSPGGEGQGEGGPTSNIEHPTSNIQHPTVEPEEKGGPTTNLEPRTLNLEPRTSEAVEGTPSPGGEGEGGTITNTEHPTSNLEHRTATAARVDGGPMPKIENQKSGQGLVLLCLAAALILGYALGWKALRPRMAQLSEGFEGREQMYDAARPMAADYPVFGTGPGTFESVFQLYRITTDTYWPAQLHNDWLETRITFGWVGCGLIGLALAIVVMRWFGRGGIPGGRRFTFLIWLALAGCLIHARYDFPFQIYSIVFLFLVLCAVLFNLSRRA